MLETPRFAVQPQVFSRRHACVLVLSVGLLGCTAPSTQQSRPTAQPDPMTEAPAPEGLRVHLVDIVEGTAVVHGAPQLVTLLSLDDQGTGSRCVGEVQGGVVVGCEGDHALIAIEGDVPATLVPSERQGVPSIDVDSAMVGGFAGATPSFSISSERSPDGLCPAAPTDVTLFSSSARAEPTGTVIVDASIPREEGSLVRALIITPTEVLVILAWGVDSRRVVTLSGTVRADGHVRPALADCDCCD